ncbi:hypothetical protein KY349_02065, partial [Candidatus Woesearchaeota archaeon]|nr:hypothetical protein [Candidatus Woesearchaeota archaeon]
DNCDGDIDENCPAPEPEQQEQPTPQQAEEQQPELEIPTRQCIDNDGDTFGQYCTKGFDCNDADPSINPEANEICNNRDDNCNNIADEFLVRPCGVSDIGACTFAEERCLSGVWAGCTAIVPQQEICGNNLDDDCDGQTDEDCIVELTDDERALQNSLNSMYGEGQYDWGRYLNNYKRTQELINITKSSKASNGKTRVDILITPAQTLRNLTIFEQIPKAIARSAYDVVFSVEPVILEEDPLFAWHFEELDYKTEISYEFVGEVEDADTRTRTLAVAEEVKPPERPWFYDLAPLIIIPVIGLFFIILIEIAHKKKKKS